MVGLGGVGEREGDTVGVETGDGDCSELDYRRKKKTTRFVEVHRHQSHSGQDTWENNSIFVQL